MNGLIVRRLRDGFVGELVGCELVHSEESQRIAALESQLAAANERCAGLAAALDRLINVCQLSGGSIDGIRVDDLSSILAAEIMEDEAKGPCRNCHGTGRVVSYELGSGGDVTSYPCGCGAEWRP